MSFPPTRVELPKKSIENIECCYVRMQLFNNNDNLFHVLLHLVSLARALSLSVRLSYV